MCRWHAQERMLHCIHSLRAGCCLRVRYGLDNHRVTPWEKDIGDEVTPSKKDIGDEAQGADRSNADTSDEQGEGALASCFAISMLLLPSERALVIMVSLLGVKASTCNRLKASPNSVKAKSLKSSQMHHNRNC